MGILNFLFPKKCVECGEKSGYLCEKCRKKLEYSEPQLSFPEGPIQGLLSIYTYQDEVVQKLVKKYKYAFLADLNRLFSELILDFLEKNFEKDNFRVFKNFVDLQPLVLPVPLHAQRFAWRGFNQAELLARGIAEGLGLQMKNDLLARIENTPPQVDLQGREREKNVCGAFQAAEDFQAQRVLLVDDVWTTGATIKECARVLKKKTAEEVWGLTFCRTCR